MSEKVVEIQGLVKRYGDLLALDDFNLSVDEGEVFALLGPNGSGKTTAINCMLALLRYDSGSVRLFGQEMRATSYDLKKQIGVVFQNVAVLSELTVRENIDYFCSLYVPQKVKRQDLVAQAIEFVGLNQFQKMRPHQLSGGLLRRLNIACGIAHQPKLLFFDEPTVAVDPQSRNAILEGITQLNKEGATIIYTTHYMEEVEQIASRIMIMDAGRAIATGTKAELAQKIDIGESIRVELSYCPGAVVEEIQALPGVRDALLNTELLEITTVKGTQSGPVIGSIIDVLNKNSVAYDGFHFYTPTLNELFLAITGKNLRD